MTRRCQTDLLLKRFDERGQAKDAPIQIRHVHVMEPDSHTELGCIKRQRNNVMQAYSSVQAERPAHFIEKS